MKYHKKLDDKTWVTFEEGEDMEWKDLWDLLRLSLVVFVPLVSIFGLICWLFEVLG